MTIDAREVLKKQLTISLAVNCSTWDEVCQRADGHSVNKTECFFMGVGVITPQDITNECHRLLNRGGLPCAPSWARYLALDKRSLGWHWFDNKPYYCKEKEEWFPLTAKSRIAFAGTAINLPAGYDCEKSLYVIEPPATLKKSVFSRVKTMFKRAFKCAN